MDKIRLNIAVESKKEDRNLRFRKLVEDLLSESDLLKFQDTRPYSFFGDSAEAEKIEKARVRDDRISILEAIEKKELSSYVPQNASDEILDAVNYLTAIYDELGRDEPDKDFLRGSIERLKEYL